MTCKDCVFCSQIANDNKYGLCGIYGKIQKVKLDVNNCDYINYKKFNGLYEKSEVEDAD